MFKTLRFLSFIVGLLIFAGSVRPDLAQALTFPYQITPIIPEVGASRGETYFTSEFEVDYQGGTITFSGNSDGGGYTAVDDAVEIVVTRPDNTAESFNIDYSGGCSGIRPQPPQDITPLFAPGQNTVFVRLYDICGSVRSSRALYLNISGAPQPSPPPSLNFLDLPWDYRGRGMSFYDAALAINSYFDHEYPLLNSGLGEPVQLIPYSGPPRSDIDYSSHDGYDWGTDAGALGG